MAAERLPQALTSRRAKSQSCATWAPRGVQATEALTATTRATNFSSARHQVLFATSVPELVYHSYRKIYFLSFFKKYKLKKKQW